MSIQTAIGSSVLIDAVFISAEYRHAGVDKSSLSWYSRVYSGEHFGYSIVNELDCLLQELMLFKTGVLNMVTIDRYPRGSLLRALYFWGVPSTWDI